MAVQGPAQRRITAGTGMYQEREGVGVRWNATAAHLVEQTKSDAWRGCANDRVEGEWRERGDGEAGEEEEREGEGEAGGGDEEAGSDEGVASEARDDAVGHDGEKGAEGGGREDERQEPRVAPE
jgi:hypothetical protein